MIRSLLSWLCGIDCTGPWTAEPLGGGPALDCTIDERVRNDDQARALYRLSDVLYPNGSRINGS